LKILMCTSEVTPLAQTGGLAEVVGALTPELKARGHDVRIILPLYGFMDRRKLTMKPAIPELGVPVGYGEQWCAVHETKLPGTDVPVYLIEHQRYFDRPSPYGYAGQDFGDNAERFAFFSRAALQVAKALQFSPDVIHGHDWQTGLVPVFLKTFEADHPSLWSTASVISLHNVGYQGQFPQDDIAHSQLGWQRQVFDSLEFHGKINYLKAGIRHADKVSTVSPTYAREIQTAEGGYGLDGVLRDRAADLVGILNGCDYREWDPSKDPNIPAKFDVDDLAGKAVCKKALQELFQLQVRPDVPVIAMVGRLAYQKGIDVLAGAIPRILGMDVQLVFLGTGETWAHFFYGDLPARNPGRVGSFIGFDVKKAHLCYAGADYFLMPSRYEPCGLTQLISKRYGTLPIARGTGGLVDTVDSYHEATGGGDGFLFHDLNEQSIADTVGWAVSTWYDRPAHHQAMVQRAMKQRFSWADSATRYEDLYRWAIERRREG
jgi:starch synthase